MSDVSFAVPAVSRATICYEAVQRVYRRVMVSHVRSRMRSAFPTDWLTQLRKPFGKDWDELAASAQAVRSAGAVDAVAQDEFDYIGVERFFNLVETHVAVLFPAIAALPDIERAQTRSALLRWIKQIKDVRDPMSHPVESDFSFADSYTTLDAARRVLKHVSEEAAEQIEMLSKRLIAETYGSKREEERTGLEGTLPARETIAVAFVGRKSELAQLQSWLEDSTSRRWALAGEGGKGKTALAFTFAARAKGDAPKPLQLMIWLSAKRRRFVEGLVQEIAEPDFTDLGTALDRLLLAYGWDHALDWEVGAKRLAAVDLLRKVPALVVVDDIDAVEGQAEAAIEFFTTDVTRTPSKVLLTSRRILFGLAASTTQIEGLSGDEADEYIDTRIQIMRLDPRLFPSNVRAEILMATEGSPLYIEDLLRLCAIGISPSQAVLRWRMSSGDEARKYALAREFEKLTRAARMVLIACALNPAPLSLAELRLITNLSEDVLHGAVDELQRLYLVPKPKLIESVERFDLNVNVASLVRSVTSNTDEYRQVEAAVRQLTNQVIASGRVRQDVLQYLRQGVTLARTGDLAKAEEVLQAGLAAHPNEADILGQLGWLYSKWPERPRLADARMFFRRAGDMKCRQADMYIHWVDMEIKAHDLRAALAAVDAGLAQRPNHPPLLRRAGYVHSRLADELRAQSVPSRAAEELRQANAYYERALAPEFDPEPESVRIRGLTYTDAIRNYESLGDLDGAARLLSKWMNEPHSKQFYEERARFVARHRRYESQLRLAAVPKF